MRVERMFRVARAKLWRTPKCRVLFKWWSFHNWRKGYKFGPIQRCRACDHTTPYHYDTCSREATP